jgi:hypothetical protein
MEYDLNNASATRADGRAQERFDVARALEPARVAPVEIQQGMLA